ncbi:MAG TPA: hypothetical protein VLO11_03040, partial [Luteolibacter sp.]|nr:hypothetical protein [Luteolibacter sp.]
MNDRRSGSTPNPLQVIKGKDADEFCRDLVSVRLADPPISDSWAENYHRALFDLLVFALREAPDRFDPLLEWSGFLNHKDEPLMVGLASAMDKAGRREPALAMLAKRYFDTRRVDDNASPRFPSKSDASGAEVRRKLPLRDLATAGLLEPLAAIAATTESNMGNEAILAAIRLAAAPTGEMWDRLAIPVIDAAPASERDSLRLYFTGVAKTALGGDDLKIRLILEDLRGGRPNAGLPSIWAAFAILEKSGAGDRGAIASRLWEQALRIIDTDPNRDSFLLNILPRVALVGDRPLWISYLERMRSSDKQLEQLAFSSGFGLSGDVDEERLADLARLLIEKVRPEKKPGGFVRTTIARLGMNDTYDSLLTGFRPWFDAVLPEDGSTEQDYLSARRFIKLLAGDPSAVQPALDAVADASGGWRFRWALAGDERRDAVMPIARAFKTFNGKFDLMFLAGPEPDKLSRVGEIQAADAAGSMPFNVPPDARFAAMIATARAGGTVRWTRAIEV